jgi:hypothetical protein
MSEHEEYTPPMGQIRSAYADTAYSDARQDALLAAFDRALDAHDRALRKQIARDIEQHYLGPDSGRCFDGRDAPDAAEREAFDEGLQFAARIARGEDQTDE